MASFGIWNTILGAWGVFHVEQTQLSGETHVVTRGLFTLGSNCWCLCSSLQTAMDFTKLLCLVAIAILSGQQFASSNWHPSCAEKPRSKRVWKPNCLHPTSAQGERQADCSAAEKQRACLTARAAPVSWVESTGGYSQQSCQADSSQICWIHSVWKAFDSRG